MKEKLFPGKYSKVQLTRIFNGNVLICCPLAVSGSGFEKDNWSCHGGYKFVGKLVSPRMNGCAMEFMEEGIANNGNIYA